MGAEGSSRRYCLNRKDGDARLEGRAMIVYCVAYLASYHT